MTTTGTTSTMGIDPDLTAMMHAVFADYRQDHPPAERVVLDAGLWRNLEGLGLVRLTGAESSGGSGAGWPEAVALLSAAVHHGVRIPLAEHDLLACWLLGAVGLPIDGAIRTVAVLDSQGRARAVPWASGVQRIVVVWPTADGHAVGELDAAATALRLAPGTNMIGEPRDAVNADITALEGVPVTAGQLETLALKSALIRSIQVCAALDRILTMSIEHTTSRVQFGRSLSKFQAIQNQISDIASEAALARTATEAAVTAAIAEDWSSSKLRFLTAVARSCTGHAASVAVRNAHQVHGAIGTTREHRLHEFTRPALAWRSEFGSVRSWDEQITAAALQAGGSGLWAMITG
ncbi:MAG: acyl-CoA dehydrogenase family protein [Mycobacterium sp.]